jgi:fructose-1,6-bisphosphatase/inositol monophosphatase family enzyme
MESMIDVVTGIAREAGAVLRDGFGRKRQLDFKSRSELVTDMDLASERLIVERLATHYPDHHIITEEGGGREQASRYVWLVDPLDGTNNYAHGNPFFSVSIALLEDAVLKLGVVYDPIHEECFTATLDGPALLNGQPIRVSQIHELRHAQPAFPMIAGRVPTRTRRKRRQWSCSARMCGAWARPRLTCAMWQPGATTAIGSLSLSHGTRRLARRLFKPRADTSRISRAVHIVLGITAWWPATARSTPQCLMCSRK